MLWFVTTTYNVTALNIALDEFEQALIKVVVDFIAQKPRSFYISILSGIKM